MLNLQFALLGFSCIHLCVTQQVSSNVHSVGQPCHEAEVAVSVEKAVNRAPTQ